MKKIKLNKRDVVALVILAILVIGAFIYVSYKQLQYYNYAKEMENLYTKNENPVFCIDKIVTYSSANAIDNSKGKTMQDLDICQFSDMAIFIDNLVDIKELVKESNAMGVSTEETDDEASRKIKERTIKELYIDNIKINSSSNRGQKTLLYKSPLSFGKFKVSQEENNNDEQENKDEAQNIQTNTTTDNTANTAATSNTTSNTSNIATDTTADNTTNANTATSNAVNLLDSSETTDTEKTDEGESNSEEEQIEQPDRIDFEIISNNVDNERNDYSKPVFYSDCSNPITLGYLNKNIVTGYAVSTQDTKIKFDGSILKSVGINLGDLACELSFDIHMKNNLDQKFTCSVGLEIPLSSDSKSIYDGYMYGMQNELKDKYRFFKN